MMLVASVAGAALSAGVGCWLERASLLTGEVEKSLRARDWLHTSLAESLARLSYDLPFVLRGPLALPPACIVYLDERSAAKLGQKPEQWDRALHARLVRRLQRAGARAVFFDIVFADAMPEADADFAAAIAEHGRVFLGAAFEPDFGANVIQERTVPPTTALRRSAAGWGLIDFRPVDADYGVRRNYTGMETIPSAAWRAAIALGASLPDTPEARAVPRWLNYYGPPNSFPNIGYDRALSETELPPDFFRDRIVAIGGRSTLDSLRLGKDDFRTPYGLFGAAFSEVTKGVELHVTALMNLLRGEWLSRLDPPRELLLVLVAGALLGGGLPWLRPPAAALAALLAIAAIAVLAQWTFVQHRLWWAWCIPALVQTPLALGWAVGARYFVAERRRHALRTAFAHYLSPQMADRIADSDVELAPGGQVVEATVMFTDLENFTALCEQWDNPARVSQVLVTYFTQTTDHILENDGTIIKYMGDAVQAVWGAPMADADHARKAALAAWRLHVASRTECEGHSLRTRIGLNTGPVLAGNLGSAQRFDFAVIGDSVNFASRLEGLNKYLGTDILISDSVQQRLGGAFVTRCLGEFRVVGKKEARTIHELLGPAPAAAPMPWIESFTRALAAYKKGALDEATGGMHETIALRGGTDRPAQFYLERIAEAQKAPLPPDWSGVVELSAK